MFACLLKMAEGNDYDRVKSFACTVFRELIYAGGESVAIDFLEKVFFKPLPKRIFDGFCRDAEFLKWEREFFLKREECSPVLKVVEGFASIVTTSVKVFLFESLKVESVVLKMKDIVFGRIAVDRWLFADKPERVRCRALKYHKRQALRRALRECQDLKGFTGILQLFSLNIFTSFLDFRAFQFVFFREIVGSHDGQHVLSRAFFRGARPRFTTAEFLWVEKYRKENSDPQAIIRFVEISGSPKTTRWIFNSLKPEKMRYKHFGMLTRSKRLKLRYLQRCVKKGLDYACLNVCERHDFVDWHRIFDAYIFLKDVFVYIVCNRLGSILKDFLVDMFSPIFQTGFIDILEKRLISFTLKGKECLIVFGILTCLEKAIAEKIVVKIC